jgi:hypothetical protein
MNRRRCGIPGLVDGPFVLLLVALAASSGRAEAAGAGGPFAKLDQMNVEVEIGGPLDLEGRTVPELFSDEVGRCSRFQRTLARTVGEKLESCGILWDQSETRDVVSIFVFGRLEKTPGGPSVYVYLVRGQVVNSKLAERGAEAEPVPLRSVIGLAADAGLEEAILDAAYAIVAEELGSCD